MPENYPLRRALDPGFTFSEPPDGLGGPTVALAWLAVQIIAAGVVIGAKLLLWAFLGFLDAFGGFVLWAVEGLGTVVLWCVVRIGRL